MTCYHDSDVIIHRSKGSSKNRKSLIDVLVHLYQVSTTYRHVTFLLQATGLKIELCNVTKYSLSLFHTLAVGMGLVLQGNQQICDGPYRIPQDLQKYSKER